MVIARGPRFGLQNQNVGDNVELGGTKDKRVPSIRKQNNTKSKVVVNRYIRGRIDIEATLRLMVALTQKVFFF